MTLLGTCSNTRCDGPASGGWCDDHRPVRKRDERRPTATERGYGSTDWRKTRAAVVKRDPICKLCGKHRSAVADHWPDERADLIAAGVPNPDALHRLRGVCMPCHNTRGGHRAAQLNAERKQAERSTVRGMGVAIGSVQGPRRAVRVRRGPHSYSTGGETAWD